MLEKMLNEFNHNKAYGDFLKQHYHNAIFYPKVILDNEKEMTVGVVVEFEKRAVSNFDLYLQKDAAGVWWIIDQYAPPQ